MKARIEKTGRFESPEEVVEYINEELNNGKRYKTVLEEVCDLCPLFEACEGAWKYCPEREKEMR